MNRKHFLSLVPATLLLNSLSGKADAAEQFGRPKRVKIPAYLSPGDTIGITCPAGYITLAEIEPAVAQMKSWGFNVVIGKTVGARNFTFGGTDLERLTDLQQMLDDPDIKAIMCARGGYGAVRIVDELDFGKFKKSPKWIIGFSDITILHCHINSNHHIATLHSKMCNSFPSDWALADPIQIETINSIQQALKGEKMKYTAQAHPNNKMGSATAELIGGNMRCIENLGGSSSEITTAGKILFVEDTGEQLYSIDRMFYNLKRSGKLDQLKGLIVGGFKLKKDEDFSFGRSVVEIVLDITRTYGFPVGFNFPVGHQVANFALKCGVKHHLEVSEAGTILTEV
ncbi:MAG: LD-carboxypeptidase [Pedobacter sp.]|nr:LD-carboxypeptidase [Pedobacter sp.]MDQ8051861.1 LD-carboxypeptidase [Pedobacter sp.]